jgi:S-adenosylmethionine:tRNA ribosyltransferase-isomerase
MEVDMPRKILEGPVLNLPGLSLLPLADSGISVEQPGLNFKLPSEFEASEPVEARGLSRDQVKLLVSYAGSQQVVHSDFCKLSDFLDPGDLLVINTSGTLNAALEAIGPDGAALELHLSTHLSADVWSLELRLPGRKGSQPYFLAREGQRYQLPANGTATLLSAYHAERGSRNGHKQGSRLWKAKLDLPGAYLDYLARYGFPIRYSYVKTPWPGDYYQTVYATEPGSAEMPSAGRAFTPELITRLVAKGVQIAPLILHTGVASLEEHEPPYAEFYRVPAETAERINAAHDLEKRVVAVGTTVVRALETVTGPDGITRAGEGWTDLVIAPPRGIQAVNGLLTGFHEPRSSHLWMLAAFCGVEHLKQTYQEALANGYRWHEFGDLHLILK